MFRDVAAVVGTVAMVAALIAYDLYQSGTLRIVANIILTGRPS